MCVWCVLLLLLAAHNDTIRSTSASRTHFPHASWFVCNKSIIIIIIFIYEKRNKIVYEPCHCTLHIGQCPRSQMPSHASKQQTSHNISKWSIKYIYIRVKIIKVYWKYGYRWSWLYILAVHWTRSHTQTLTNNNPVMRVMRILYVDHRTMCFVQWFIMATLLQSSAYIYI